MTKLLLVDDEFYFREYLKTCIDWESLECRIVGEASDGEEALALTREKRPDIVLLDINMPCVDGIAFSRIISKEQPNCRIIIVSGHSEFQYAQKAMKYGVKSYLLKPLDEEELCQTIGELKEDIQKQKSYQEQLTRLEKKHQPFVEEKWLNSLIHGILPANEDDLPLHEENDFLMLALEIDHISRKQWGSGEQELWYYAVKNVTEELILGSAATYFGRDKEGRILCLVERKESMESLPEYMKICVTKITAFAASHFPFILTAGLGTVGKGISGIQKSYQQAVFSLKNTYINQENRVLDYERARIAVSQNTFLNFTQRSQILIYLRQGNQKAVEELLHEIFQIARMKCISYDMLQCHCTEFIFLCLEYLEEREYSFEMVFPNCSSPLSMLEAIHNIEEAEKEILNFYAQVFQFMQLNQNPRVFRQTEEIKAYVKEHFHEQDFKISDIAERFALNYHYLCHSFKQQTGFTLNQYINRVRIDCAKEMMDQGYCNLTLLAEKVGYSDLGYFGKCFKKQTGIAPSRYLNKNVGKET